VSLKAGGFLMESDPWYTLYYILLRGLGMKKALMERFPVGIF